MLQVFAGTAIFGPVYGPVAIIVAATLLVAVVIRPFAQSRQSRDPLSSLFEPEILELEIEATERRKAAKSARATVLSGRIDHLAQIGSLWGPETRADAISQVAQVMRAGVRRGDTVTTSDGPEDDGSFVIVTRGANEEEASGIAKRLLQDLSRVHVSGMSKSVRLSASIGVATHRLSEGEREWHARARAALEAAQASGEERVVAAGDWEEIALLPSPSTNMKSDAEANAA